MQIIPTEGGGEMVTSAPLRGGKEGWGTNRSPERCSARSASVEEGATKRKKETHLVRLETIESDMLSNENTDT